MKGMTRCLPVLMTLPCTDTSKADVGSSSIMSEGSVARALATGPELLMLDELMAGLNATEIADAMELVGQIREKGITVIMIEHVMRAIMNVCERIMVLHHGEKIAEGTPHEIATSEKVIKVYLGDKANAGS